MKVAYAGVHWPNGPEDYTRIMALPSSLLLMLATEGRYHYDTVRRAGKTVIWRALPRIGERPAEIGWSKIKQNADEVMNLWDEQPHYGEEWFVPYNELDLNFERGDHENDFENIPERLEKITKFLDKMLDELDKRLPEDTKILFPPFTPDHGDRDNLHIWKSVAKDYDGILIHAYGEPEEIRERVEWYLTTFPDSPIFLGEWNSPKPGKVLEILKELSEKYSNFKGATYFIWHWYGSPSHWPNEYNIDEREELYTLFKNASDSVVEDSPLPSEPPAPTFIWPNEPKAWNQDDIIDESNRVADHLRIPRRLLLGLLITESSLNWSSSRFAYRNEDGTYTDLTASANRAIKDRDISEFRRILSEISKRGSTDISFGVGQQTVRWADEGDHTHSADNVLFIRNLYFNPKHAIAVAGRKIAHYYGIYKNDIEALSRYNKPQLTVEENSIAVAKYRKGLIKADDILSELGDVLTTTTTFIAKTTPHIAGNFNLTPKGFILHGSRSGVAGRPKSVENAACANWCVNPNNGGLGWHASIGEYEVYVHMPVNNWGWNARAASDDYIAVEFAQGTVQEAITEGQIEAFVEYVKRYVLPVYPNIPMNFVTHADVEVSGETGQKDGKTDVFPAGSLEATILKDEIRKRLKSTPVVTPRFSFQFGFADKAKELGEDVVGVPLENETYIGSDSSYQTTTKGIMFYSKNANKVTFLEGK